MKILLTGMAGFIGFHLALALAKRGDSVLGVDNINDYYDVSLKFARLENAGFVKDEVAQEKLTTSQKYQNLSFIRADLTNSAVLADIFDKFRPDVVVNLAAQAGVRYSLINPKAYIDSNISGFLNILECCRHNEVKNLVYASSSSVYGLNESMPFSTHNGANHPISLYAASKKSNEMMAHTYSHLFGLPTTGLRFFTVYGEWGRPDMALFIFTKAAFSGEEIEVFNQGKMMRDFTYIADIIQGILLCIDNPAKPNLNWDAKLADPASSSAPFKIYNIGNSKPVELMQYINAIENATGRSIKKRLMPLQAGDVVATYADVSDLALELGYKPQTSVSEGVERFVAWYKEFYGV